MACKVALYNVIDKLIANKPYISFNKEHGVIDVKNSVTNRINNNNRAAITYSFANQFNKKIKDLIKDKTLGDILYVNWENNVPYILVGPTDRQLNIINNQLSNNTSEVVKKDFEKEKFLRETALRQKRANEYIDDVGDVYPTLQDAIAASNRKEIENNVNNFITLEEAEQVIKDLYPEITPYFDITGKPNFKEDKDVFNQKEDNVQNQRNENNRIIGQADIKAGTVLIDMLRRKKDTIPHEYAHHYIAWFRNAPIVQEAIKKWGSEEALVQAIGEQSVKQNGEAWSWWKSFVKWMQDLFADMSTKDREELKNILTDAFLEARDLETFQKGISEQRQRDLANRASGGVFNQGQFQKLTAESFNENESLANISSLGKLQGDLMESEKGQIGVNKQQLLMLLGPTMYNKPLAQVAVKELLQNSFDAIKARMNITDNKETGNIDIKVDYDNRTISIKDDGIGMTPDIVKNAFLSIGGTNKEGLDVSERSGGFGLAKVQFLLGSEYVKVITVRDGIKTSLEASAVQLYNDDFTINKEQTNEPNGSYVEVKIPESYTTSEGTKREIEFPGKYKGDSVKYSAFNILDKPLIGNVNVSFTHVKNKQEYKKVVPIGENTTEETLPPLFSKIDFSWGSADLYMSTDKKESPKHRILSSGIYQFDYSFSFKDWENIPYDIVVNIKPSVSSTSEQYPFNNQREGFKNTVKEDIKSLNNYLKKYASGEAEKDAKAVFSNITGLPKVDPNKVLTPEEREKLYADVEKTIAENKQRRIEQGLESAEEEVRKIWKLVIDKEGVKDAETGKVEVSNEKNYGSSFKAEKEIEKVEAIETTNFNPALPQYHNNTNFDYLKIPGAAEFFSDFGSVVLEMVRFAGNELGYDYRKLKSEDEKFFAGVSIDKQYGGVHVRKIINAIFVNPLAFDVSSLEEAVGVALHVTIHEINHTTVSGEGASFTTALGILYGKIYATGKYGLYEGLFRSIYKKHFETFKQLKNEYDKSSTRNLSESFSGDQIKKSITGNVQRDVDDVSTRQSSTEGYTGNQENNTKDRTGDVILSKILGSKQDIEGFKKFIQDKPNSVKLGVKELFESNPELANAVYEALWVNIAQLKEDVAVTNAFLNARQHEEAKRINSGEFDDTKLDLKTELQNIIDSSTNPLLVELAKSIQNKESLKTIKAYSTQKPFKTKEGFEPAAAYQAETQRLVLFLGNTARFENKEKEYQYLLHELVHHFVDRELVLTNSKQAENIRQLFKYTKYQLTKAGKENLYGLTNFHEFVTEALTNLNFQKELKSLQVPDQFLTKSFSIFDYFLELISKILGTNKSVLEAVVFQAADIFELQEYKKSLSITPQQKQQARQLYSQYLESLNKLNTNPILQNNQQEQVKKFAELQERLNNKEFLEGAKNAFESSEELQNVYYEVLGVNRNNIISSNYLFEQIIKNPENEDLKKITQLLNKSNIRNRQILLKDYDSVSPTHGQAIGFIEDKKIATNVAVTDFEYLSNLTTNEFDKEFFKNQSFQETLLHEELHRYTSYLLQVYNHYFEQTKNETDAIKELKNYFENVLDKPNLEKEIEFIKEYNVLYKIYQENGGTFNNKEFITYGLTNSQEIKKLKSIKVGKDNLLDRMIKALFNLFSTPTLYDALYDTFYNYYLNFDSTKYKEFTDTVKLKLTPLNKNSYSITPQQKQDALNAYTDYIARVSLGIIKNPSSGEYNYESKVKDIVYHGTNLKFEKFDKKRIGSNTAVKGEKPSFSFTTNKNQAEAYTSEITVGENSNDLAQVWFDENQQIFKDGDISTRIIDINNVKEHFKKELSGQTEMISPFKEIDNKTDKYKLVPVNDKNLQVLAEIKTKEWQEEFDTLMTRGINIINAIVDINNPKIIDFKGEKKNQKFKDEQKSTQGDAFIAKNVDDWGIGDVIQVFEPEQIHLLGGKQDIEGFKEFVNRQNNTTPLVNVNIDLENKPITKNDIINSDVFHELITQMVSNNEINKNCK